MITIKIKENSKQAKLFVEYAKTLPFVEFEETKIVAPAKIRKIKKPNSTTLNSFSDTDKGIGLTRTTSHEDLMNKLFS